jgi:hypothetical protein
MARLRWGSGLGDIECPEPGCEMMRFSLEGMTEHVRISHFATFLEWPDAVFGEFDDFDEWGARIDGRG